MDATPTVVLHRDAFMEAIAARDWTISRAAQEFRIDRTTIYRMFNGEGQPSPQVIGNICAALSYTSEAPELAFPRLFRILPTKEKA